MFDQQGVVSNRFIASSAESKYMNLRFWYREMYDTGTGQSKLFFNPHFMSDPRFGYYYYTYRLEGWIKVDGKTEKVFGPSDTFRVTQRGVWYENLPNVPYESGVIHHNPDGTKTVKIEFYIKLVSPSGSYEDGFGGTFNESFSVTLTTVPVSATAGASAANIEEVSTISIVKSSALLVSLKYSFGALSGYIDASGNAVTSEAKISQTSIPFRVPTAFYTQIPNSKSGLCRLTCQTYTQDGTAVGQPHVSDFTVSASESRCRPSVSGAVVNSDTDGITGSPDKLLRYASTAYCTIYADARNGASIVKSTVNGLSITNTLEIPKVDTGTFEFKTTDSRGFSASVAVEKELIPYFFPTNESWVERKSPTDDFVTLHFRGKMYQGTMGSQSNVWTAHYKVGSGSDVSVPLSVADGRYTADVVVEGLSYQKEHSIYVYVADFYTSTPKYIQVKRGYPAFNWGKDNFDVNVPCYIYALGATEYRDVSSSTGFVRFIDDVYNDMQNLTARMVAVSDNVGFHPLGGGAWFFWIYRVNAEWGFCVGLSYLYYEKGIRTIINSRSEGTWSDWALTAFP